MTLCSPILVDPIDFSVDQILGSTAPKRCRISLVVRHSDTDVTADMRNLSLLCTEVHIEVLDIRGKQAEIGFEICLRWLSR